jgi:hypothetical protein
LLTPQMLSYEQNLSAFTTYEEASSDEKFL